MNWTDEDLRRRNREVLGIDPFYGGTFTRVELVPQSQVCPSRPYAWDNEPPADLKPEWMIEAECTKILEEDGWRALRTDPVSDRGRGKGFGEIGMADHLYLRYGPGEPLRRNNHQPGTLGYLCAVMWIEFKSAKGKPTSKQLEWHQNERARGALTLIAGQDFPASIEGFRAWYRGSGLQRV